MLTKILCVLLFSLYGNSAYGKTVSDAEAEESLNFIRDFLQVSPRTNEADYEADSDEHLFPQLTCKNGKYNICWIVILILVPLLILYIIILTIVLLVKFMKLKYY